MNSLIDAAFDRTRTVLSALVLLLVAGGYVFVTIPKEAAPDVNIPVIYASMHHTGISPEDAVRLLVKPMEQKLRQVEGVDTMRSTAYEGGANVLLTFEAGFDADRALREVREQADKARADLPEATDEPTVNEVNLSKFPVLVVALSGAVPRDTLIHSARELRDRIEGLPGVLEAAITGEREESAELVLDPAVLHGYGLQAGDIAGFVERSNRLIPAGAMDTGHGRFPVKVPGLLKNVKDVLGLPVKAEGDRVITLRDVAAGRRTFKDPESFARVDGRSAVALEVSKRVGENIIGTVERVRALVDRTRAHLPDGLHVTFMQDQSDIIENRLRNLQNSVLSAVLLVMIVVVGALGVRAAGLVGLAIPGSFLTAILVLGAAGMTVNIVVLFGLILAVGMLVDGAIVVVEYADRRMTEGDPPPQAYARAARRMAPPVIAATVTTLAAFLPLLFWSGVVGEFMKFLPVTLLATLTASLLMALIFVPTLGGLVGRPGAVDARTRRALEAGETGDLDSLPGLTGWYIRLLRRLLRHPAKVLAVAVAGLVGSYGLYAVYGHGVEFFPDVEPQRASVNVHARGNLSVWEKNTLVRRVERRLVGLDGVKAFYTRVNASDRQAARDQIGRVLMEFKPWGRRRPAAAILAEARERTSGLAGLKIEVREQQGGPQQGKPVQMRVSGPDDRLIPAVARLRQAMARMGGFEDVTDSRPLPGIQWEVDVDREKAARFGIDLARVGQVVQLATNGLTFDSYRPDDSREEVDIVMRYPRDERTLSRLRALRVDGPRGPVPVSSVATLRPEPKVTEIERVNGERVYTVEAGVKPGVLPDDKVKDLRAWLDKADLPGGVTVEFVGEEEEQAESRAFLMKAFAVALFLMAVILVTQFNSFYLAFLILSAVVLSTIGVMLGQLMAGKPFGVIMSGIGVIALAGIVVNNNIVLLDTYVITARRTTDAMEAILRTGAQRLRPVLLTVATTVLGLLPMVFKVNIDLINRTVTFNAPSMQWWQQLSTAVVSGLLFATVLTLVVTPCALMVKANVRGWVEQRKGA